MSNPATTWAATLVDGLARAGVATACLAPGSRCTPLTMAITAHDEIEPWSIIDERSAAFVALGRARATGEPTVVVTTSGTAVANCHPAVVEADEGRVPLLLLTADRPHERRDSGANQTIDQVGIFGDAPRWERDLPAPRMSDIEDDRSMRSLRVAAARAVGAATQSPAGPVHLNCAFRKPLEPDRRDGVVPSPVEVAADDGPPTETTAKDVNAVTGERAPTNEDRDRLARVFEGAERPLVVAGPAAPCEELQPLARLAERLDAPLLADPLSGLRGADTDVVAGYDGYLQPEVVEGWPTPDLVLRAGESPTSRRLRNYLADTDARSVLVDSAGGWREATFTATDHVVASVPRLVDGLLTALPDETGSMPGWCDRFATAERRYWEIVRDRRPAEAGAVVGSITATPAEGTVVVGNGTPIRDVDRFLAPSAAAPTLLGNRGASGIDGTISTAVGAATGSDGPTVCVLGDLATLHDATGLSALARVDPDLTIVVVHNDGGGIFHALPVSAFDPPFTEWFRTPHETGIEALGDAFGTDTDTLAVDAIEGAVSDAVDTPGTRLIVVRTDAGGHHADREALDERVVESLSTDQ